MTTKELSDLAENFYLGKINADEVIAKIDYYSDFASLKSILAKRMIATAEALCKVLDNAASKAEGKKVDPKI